MRASILVVDDDQGVRETFAHTLRHEGYDVRTAPNAEIGLSEVKAARTDAIILDLRMPLINGIGFLYRLRAQAETRELPVAVITGDHCVKEALCEEMQELGAELFYKPLWVEDIVDLTRNLLDKPRRLQPPVH
ncbi:MAG: response regulator [Acidobacteria bacterium]|nr:response regulator [Acidobacteriota bacterium]